MSLLLQDPSALANALEAAARMECSMADQFSTKPGRSWMDHLNPKAFSGSPKSAVAFRRQIIMSRKPFDEAAHDKILDMKEGGVQWFPLPGLKNLVLDAIRDNRVRGQQEPRDVEDPLVDYDIWEVVKNNVTIRMALEAIKTERGSPNLAMSFKNIYRCMLHIAMSDERFPGPRFFLCRVPAKNEFFVVAHAAAMVTHECEDIFGMRGYGVQLVTAFKLSPFRIPKGAIIIVPEESGESDKLAIELGFKEVPTAGSENPALAAPGNAGKQR